MERPDLVRRVRPPTEINTVIMPAEERQRAAPARPGLAVNAVGSVSRGAALVKLSPVGLMVDLRRALADLRRTGRGVVGRRERTGENMGMEVGCLS